MLEARLQKCYDYDAEGVGRMMDTKTGLKIADRRKMPETLRTLSFAKEKHAGQYRKGERSVYSSTSQYGLSCSGNGYI